MLKICYNEGVGNTKSNVLTAGVATVSILFLGTACGTSNEEPRPDITASSPAVAEVYPQKGYVGRVSSDNGKTWDCNTSAKTDLKMGGTVTNSSTNVTVDQSDPNKIIVKFSNGTGGFASGGIVNGDTPFLIPNTNPGETPFDVLSLSASDFGPITAISICGGGM
ncbi:MAG: hypothetical protein JWM07_74 [Candidatus Saccharibacteria bacterium]|nr:hypothetical protein [Candidatus Saccharibacteria bacterium]